MRVGFGACEEPIVVVVLAWGGGGTTLGVDGCSICMVGSTVGSERVKLGTASSVSAAEAFGVA